MIARTSWRSRPKFPPASVARLAPRATAACLALAALAATGCGGAKKEAAAAKSASDAKALEADPLAILPGAVVALARVDARALYTSESFGKKIASLTERLVPFGAEAGFVPSRDLDVVTVGLYSTEGADVAAVLRGRFDPAKIDAAARARATPSSSSNGSPVVASSYGGRTLYTVNNAGFVVLSAETVLAGSETEMRRVLDRIQDGHAKRELAPWIVSTVETDGAAVAAAGDFANQPVPASILQAAPARWLQGAKAVRLVGNFASPGMNVAGSVTFADAQQAAGGEGGLKAVVSLVNVFAMAGAAPKVTNLQTKVAETDLQYSFALDEQSLSTFLSLLPRMLGQ